mgnify:CR=1 FL=1
MFSLKQIKNYFSNVKKAFKNEQGFTLLELIAVIAILGIIAAISFTAFSTQGEKARISANKTNIVTIEQAAARYETEKGFEDADFANITGTHKLVTEGYLKEVPKNPWASTNKDQKNFVYVVTKDKRGMFFAYLVQKAATPTQYVNTDKDENAEVVDTTTAGSPQFDSAKLTDSSAADDRQLDKADNN